MISLAETEVDTARATIVGLACRSRGSIGTATGGGRTGLTVVVLLCCCVVVRGVMMMKPRSRSWTVLRGFVECGSGAEVLIFTHNVAMHSRFDLIAVLDVLSPAFITSPVLGLATTGARTTGARSAVGGG